MHPFTLERPRELSTALAFRAQAGRNDATAEYIAGGTDMVQLLQEHVLRPSGSWFAGLLDNRIEVGPGGLRLAHRIEAIRQGACGLVHRHRPHRPLFTVAGTGPRWRCGCHLRSRC